MWARSIGIDHRVHTSAISVALESYMVSGHSLAPLPSCSIPIVYRFGFTPALMLRHLGFHTRPA